METTGVTDRDVQGGDSACVCTGGGPVAHDRLADEGVRRGEPTWMGQRGVVVADQRVVIAREAVVEGRADQCRLPRVGVPGVGDLPAVPGSQEIVGASTDNVEAERAAVPAAV